MLRVVIDFFRLKWIGGLGGRVGGFSPVAEDADLLSQCEVVTGEFDATFYAACYPQASGDPLRHFMTEGWRAGYDPAPYFSTASYLHSYPDVMEAGLNPFYHYIRHGRAEGRVVPPAREELRSWEIEAIRRELEENFYAEQLRGRNIDPTDMDMALHYWREGARLGFDPARDFSTAHYLASHADVAAERMNPFAHYLEHGRNEGRSTRSIPAPEPRTHDFDDATLLKDAFDADFYLAAYPDIAAAAADPLAHFMETGWKERRNPNPWFNVGDYLEIYPDVADAGTNPFIHYLITGKSEGRSTRSIPVPEPRSHDIDEATLLKNAFDADFYLAAYPDIAAAALDPLAHFMETGWKERRNPNPWFNAGDYLDFYPDVADAETNPFIHYLLTGKSEGRIPRHELGFRYDIIKSLQPLEVRIDQARTSTPARALTPPKELRDALRHATRLERQGLYISASHDDFTENFGGVQLVLMRESAAVDEMGFDHLHLFPASTIPVAELDTRDPVLGVLLNGKRIGFFPSSKIEQELRTVAPRLRTRPFAIHSLIRHSAEALASILKAAGCKAGWYWVHDYSSVCTGYNLLRNDVEFCGGPPPASTACSLCVYGSLRLRQMKAHELLFKDFDLTVLAPSDTALRVWKASASVAAPAHVHEHLQFATADGTSGSAKVRSVHRPLRVAHVGQAVSHKGWFAFRDLALQFCQDPRYEFYHLGKGSQLGVPVIYKEVVVGLDDLDKMVRVLRELKIDVAILWSLWPETFCIAAAEALCAGTALLTFKDSGNIAAMVQKTGFGAVLDSEEELHQLFETGDVLKLAATARARGLTAKFSNMTADLIERTVA